MSRVSNVLENPAIKTFKWKNTKTEVVKDENGKTVKENGVPKKKVLRDNGWYYWDKSLNDGEGAEVLLTMPFSFVWLESATSFSGYNKDKSQGVYSNEVLDVKTQPLTVKCGQEVIAEGLYHSIKDEVKGQGGKFCQPLYALMQNGDDYEVVRFLMTGSSRDAWFTFSNKLKNKTNSIVCYDVAEKETPNGDIFELPVFKYMPLNDKFAQEADRIAVEVIDPYFKYILDKPKEVLEEVDYND